MDLTPILKDCVIQCQKCGHILKKNGKPISASEYYKMCMEGKGGDVDDFCDCDPPQYAIAFLGE